MFFLLNNNNNNKNETRRRRETHRTRVRTHTNAKLFICIIRGDRCETVKGRLDNDEHGPYYVRCNNQTVYTAVVLMTNF